MLVWGSGSKSVKFGNPEIKRCQTCGKDTQFRNVVEYRYAHIWYLFSWVTKKRYLSLCEICERGVELDKKQVESTLLSNPIPFQKRYGWAFLVGLIAFAIGMLVFDQERQKAADYSYLSAPQPNDLYVTDLERLKPQSSSPSLYGVMRVTRVDGDNVDFLIPKLGYSQSSATDKDINSGKAYTSDYYTGEIAHVKLSDLKTFRDKNYIKKIKRK